MASTGEPWDPEAAELEPGEPRPSALKDARDRLMELCDRTPKTLAWRPPLVRCNGLLLSDSETMSAADVLTAGPGAGPCSQAHVGRVEGGSAGAELRLRPGLYLTVCSQLRFMHSQVHGLLTVGAAGASRSASRALGIGTPWF